MSPDDLCILWHTEVVQVTGKSGFTDVMGGVLSLAFGSGTSAQRGKALGQLRRGIETSQAQEVTVTRVLEHTPPSHPLFEYRYRVVVKRATRRGDLV